MDPAALQAHRFPGPAFGGPSMRRGYGFLLAGVAALAAMELGFALVPGRSFILMVGGVLLVAIGWLMLAVLGWRSTLAATAVVAVSYVALVFTTAPLRTLSWRILVRMERDALETVAGIMEPVRMTGEARRIDARCTQLPGLAAGDCATLRAALRDIGAHGAWKEGAVMVLETYSSFNVRGGLLHCPRDCEKPSARYYDHPRYVRHVTGDWYRWTE